MGESVVTTTSTIRTARRFFTAAPATEPSAGWSFSHRRISWAAGGLWCAQNLLMLSAARPCFLRTRLRLRALQTGASPACSLGGGRLTVGPIGGWNGARSPNSRHQPFSGSPGLRSSGRGDRRANYLAAPLQPMLLEGTILKDTQ